jgi:Cu/Zn superoxide dismutase
MSVIRAVCEIGTAGQPCTPGTPELPVSGIVQFAQTEGNLCEITYKITGLTPGLHGFHM